MAHQRLLKRLSPPAGVLVVASQEPQKVFNLFVPAGLLAPTIC
ncbi:hypothetical protein HBZS_100900 [Helicobacter bizzozeronii CCUG 35545]|nr:hypothetical protein HBZS_100900 [Helicobacter bizzozeronii CCUG 35545]